MVFTLVDHPEEIREQFKSRYIMSWEAFRRENEDWIKYVTAKGYLYDLERYNKDFMWNHISSARQPTIPFREALAMLRGYDGPVLFMSDSPPCQVPACSFFGKQENLGCVAEGNSVELADLIEEEWFEEVRLFLQDMYNPDPVLVEDLYVFPESLEWAIVFTHETTDWDSELDDPMKAAESRVCILCRP